MQKVECTLIGVPQVILNNIRVQFPYKKCEALFYYLCVRKSVSREEAISILWADCSQNGARKNLRDAIYNLRKLLGNDIILTEGHNRVDLNVEMIARLDYDEVVDGSLNDLCQEDFLAYFYVKDCVEFEEWANGVRNDLLKHLTNEIEDRIDSAAAERDSKTLKDMGKILLRKKIVDEGMFRKVLNGLIRCSCYTDATELYDRLSEFLINELGTEPEKKTAAIITAIVDNAEPVEDSVDHKIEFPVRRVSPPTQFFGRKNEIAQLLGRLNRFKESDTPSVLLVGESGVGKTTLLHYLQGIFPADEFYMITHDCVESEKDLPLKAWHNIQEQIQLIYKAVECDTFENHVDVSSLDDISLRRLSVQCEYMTESMIQRLVNMRKKIVMFIDDLQWMDHNSLLLLSNLLHWSRNSEVFIIAAARAEPYPDLVNFKTPLIAKNLIEEIFISNFTTDEIREIIRSKYPKVSADKLEELLKKVCQLTGGNTFFLFEYLNNCDLTSGPIQSLELSVQAAYMVKSRLLQQDDEDMELLYCISVFPRFAMLDELVLLTGWSKREVLRRLENPLSRHIIQQCSTYNRKGYGFTHRIMQDYILDSMLEDKRQFLHSILAEHYENQFLAEKDETALPYVIYNYGQAHNDYKFFSYRLEYTRIYGATQYETFSLLAPFSGASEIEMSQYIFYDEEDFMNFDHEIRKALSKPEEIEYLSMKVKFLLGRYYFSNGQYELGAKNIQNSLEIAKKYEDPTYLMENYLQLIYHSIQIHQLKLFYECILNCEELLKKYTYSNRTACDILRLKGLYYLKNYRYQLAEEIFNQLIAKTDMYCESNPSYRIIQGICYNYLGESYQARGDLEQALEYYKSAIHCCEHDLSSNGIGVFYTNSGIVLYKMKRYKESKLYIEKAINYFSIFHALWYSARTYAYAALLALQEEEPEDAQKYLETAKKIAITSQNPLTESLLQNIERMISEGREELSNPDGNPDLLNQTT